VLSKAVDAVKVPHQCRSGDAVWQWNRERKCADTVGTVPVTWAGHFQC